MNVKAQVWTADFIVGLSLFLIVLAASITIIVSSNPEDKYDELYKDTVHLSNQLMDQGYPGDWNESNVILPGILEEKTRLSTSKLEELSKIGYNRTKNLLHTKNEYFFYFDDGSKVLDINGCVHGHNIATDGECNPLIETLEYENLVKIERMLIHDSQLIKMVVYSWN